LMILTGIVVLFFQEHRAALTAQVSPLTPKKLHRVPSDMETLIPPKIKPGSKHVTFMEITMGGDERDATQGGSTNEASDTLDDNSRTSSANNSVVT